MRLVFLDSGPLGLITNPLNRPRADACRQWAKEMTSAGVRLLIPEIADYEVRRKLIQIRAPAGIRRLNQASTILDYVPITTEAMLQAAELWAAARQAGQPTAAPDALDGDCILAAQVMTHSSIAYEIIVATMNVGHLGRFVDARAWDEIVP